MIGNWVVLHKALCYIKVIIFNCSDDFKIGQFPCFNFHLIYISLIVLKQSLSNKLPVNSTANAQTFKNIIFSTHIIVDTRPLNDNGIFNGLSVSTGNGKVNSEVFPE